MQVVTNTQMALYSELNSALEISVLDFVPEDTDMPYLTIGNSSLQHNPAAGRSVYDMVFSLRVYMTGSGRKELLDIGQQIFELLNGKPLIIDDFTHHETRLISQATQVLDKEEYVLEANYRIVVS